MTVSNSEDHRPVAEPADAADLKPAELAHEGSTPSGPTTLTSDLQTSTETIALISWSGKYIPILEKLLKLPGAMEIVKEELGPTAKQLWEQCMPASELPIEVGQKRIVFIDGIGDRDGIITRFNNTTCWFKIDGDDDDGFEWEMEWDMPGMNGIGILVDGVEHKKIMAEEAINAENSAPSNA